VIVDVEATTTIRQAEVGAAKTMLDRTAEQFGLTPSRLVADGGYGSAEMVGWLVDERGIEPHVNLIDKGERTNPSARLPSQPLSALVSRRGFFNTIRRLQPSASRRYCRKTRIFSSITI
jgi:hypothetical protein